jgi:uncharacterized UBP type Zn finger protein
MPESLIPYNDKFVPTPFGLYNTGVICYFNTLLQSLMSCSSLNHYFLINENMFKQNNNYLAILYINLLKQNLNNRNNNRPVFNSSAILNQLILMYRQKNNNNIGSGQEDIGEFLIFFLDTINNKYIEKLFIHKYQCDILCMNCKKVHNIPNDLSFQFEIPLDTQDSYEMDYLYKYKTNAIDISKYIRNNVSHIRNTICSNCKVENQLVKMSRLKYIPTILVINFNKYKHKKLFQFPTFIEYTNALLKKKYIFIIISSAEQSGSTIGGHYVCKAKRKVINGTNIESKVFLFNDISYQESDILPTLNSYIIFYHFHSSIDI